VDHDKAQIMYIFQLANSVSPKISCYTLCAKEGPLGYYEVGKNKGYPTTDEVSAFKKAARQFFDDWWAQPPEERANQRREAETYHIGNKQSE